MSDRQWVQTIRHEQTILSVPFGLGYTIDITQTLTALAAAGMPARVEAFDRLRFGDGRTAFLATPDPTTTVTDDDGAEGRVDDVILLPGGSEGGVLSLGRVAKAAGEPVEGGCQAEAGVVVAGEFV